MVQVLWPLQHQVVKPLQGSTASFNFDVHYRGQLHPSTLTVIWYVQIWLWKYFGPILGKARPRWLVFDAFAANAFWWQKTASVFGSRHELRTTNKVFFKDIPNFWPIGSIGGMNPNKLYSFWGIFGQTISSLFNTLSPNFHDFHHFAKNFAFQT